MADRYLYMGGNLAFTRNVGTPSVTTTAGALNTTYVDQGIQVTNNTSHFFTDFQTGNGVADSATAGETLWVRFDNYYSGGSFNVNSMVLVNGSDQMLFRLRVNSSTVTRLEYNSGTLATPAWTQLGTDITTASSTRYTYVLKLTIDAAGTAHAYELYKDNVLALSGTFSQSILTTVNSIKWGDTSNTGNHISQILVSVGIGLVGSFCAALKASGAGSNSGMTGAYTDVNEVTFSDATVVSSNTAAQRTTFAIGDLPALSGLVVGSEQRHCFRANNDGGSGPQNIKPVIRQSGSDTVGSAVSGITTGMNTFNVSYNLTYTQINTAGFELGWESST